VILDPVIHIIAASLDHPSVYMGGPSRQSIEMAKRLLQALRQAGYEIRRP
jgi:hypothetical protein